MVLRFLVLLCFILVNMIFVVLVLIVFVIDVKSLFVVGWCFEIFLFWLRKYVSLWGFDLSVRCEWFGVMYIKFFFRVLLFIVFLILVLYIELSWWVNWFVKFFGICCIMMIGWVDIEMCGVKDCKVLIFLVDVLIVIILFFESREVLLLVELFILFFVWFCVMFVFIVDLILEMSVFCKWLKCWWIFFVGFEV